MGYLWGMLVLVFGMCHFLPLLLDCDFALSHDVPRLVSGGLLGILDSGKLTLDSRANMTREIGRSSAELGRSSAGARQELGRSLAGLGRSSAELGRSSAGARPSSAGDRFYNGPTRPTL